MKRINLFTGSLLIIALSGFLFTGCKKDNDDSDAAAEQVQQETNATDESRVAASDDEVSDDANRIIAMHPRLRGINYQGIYTGITVPCGATVDTTLIAQGQVTVIYNGLNCNGTRTRTGSIVLQLPYDAGTGVVTPWSDAGSSFTITYNSFQVTSLNSGKSITFDGTRVITNVSGGLVDASPTFATPIVHHITGTMQMTFDNGTTRTWNIDRTRTIARTNSVTTITITGNATQGGYSNVAIWGTNRLGNSFYVTIDSPVILSSTCDYNAVSGIRMHHGVIRELTVTYGVDQLGNVVTGTCPYGFKLNWIDRNGNPKQAVISY